MIITKLVPVNKTKIKVYIEEEFAFALYKGELSKYHLKEGAELSEELYEKINKEIVQKRAKLRAMHLLNDMDRTESALRDKLKLNLYPQEAIDVAVDYVKSFGYIDDYRYAIHFIDMKRTSKSKREISQLLAQKGVSRELISMAMEECYAKNEELEAIRTLLRKKNFHSETASEKEIEKICAYLARKGFRYDDIRQVVHYSSENA